MDSSDGIEVDATQGRPGATWGSRTVARMNPRVKMLLGLVTLIVTGVVLWTSGLLGLVWAELLQLAEHIHERYGIDVPLAIALFGVGELVFCGSVAMMLRELGQRASWSNVRRFDFKHLELGSRRMVFWLWVNRLSWIVP